MKKLLTILIFLFSVSTTFAHYIWLETIPNGKLNEPHIVKIHFGEYTDGIIEKTDGDHFKNVKDFTVWVITPNGKKQIVSPIKKENYYQISFIPKENGTYTIALDNKEMNVLDFTKHDYTIFKPQYHAKSKVIIGKSIKNSAKTNSNSIEIVDESTSIFSLNSEVKLKVLYKGKALIDNEVSIFMKDSWVKKIKTDKNGIITFKLPFKTKYTLETTFEEKVPGEFKQKKYKLIWHCATYCIKLD